MSDVLQFDPECITARILAQELRDMVAASGLSAVDLGVRLGLGPDAVLAWMRGEHLKQPIQFFAALDALGYDVKFVKRGRSKRRVILLPVDKMSAGPLTR